MQQQQPDSDAAGLKLQVNLGWDTITSGRATVPIVDFASPSLCGPEIFSEITS